MVRATMPLPQRSQTYRPWGPGVVPTTKSTFGTQYEARRPTSPSYGFGTSRASTHSKVFISNEHTRERQGMSSPGPVYAIRSRFGPFDAPSYSFGTAVRDTLAYTSRAHWGDDIPGPGAYTLPDLQARRSVKFGLSERSDASKIYTSEALARVDPSLNASPGPSAYGSISTFGEYPDSRFRSSRGVAIGTQPRSYEQEAHARARIISPGPGEYGIVGGRALGSQVESHRHSAPTYSFSSADREATANVLPSRAHERVLRGRDSPSPGLYRTRGALGEQINSRKKTLPAYTFSASDRFHMDKAAARAAASPGPGQYML